MPNIHRGDKDHPRWRAPFETAAEKMRPPQGERYSVVAEGFPAHPEEAPSVQAPSRRMRSWHDGLSERWKPLNRARGSFQLLMQTSIPAPGKGQASRARVARRHHSPRAGTDAGLRCPCATGVFHPKLHLLIRETGGQILCGSNNLTRSGCSSNLELLQHREGAVVQALETYRMFSETELIHAKEEIVIP
jgi:hypothetical protein